jgi:AcrR family transcriptional regulator
MTDESVINGDLLTMARPRTEPADVRRRRILEAARGSLIESGYQELNLDAAARKAGVAKGTLYLYFKNKEDLLAAVFADMLDGAERRFKEAGPDDGTLESLRRLAADGLDFMDETHYFLSSFSPGSAVLHGPKAEAHRRRIEHHLDFVARRLETCARKGLLRPCDSRDAALLFGSLMQMFLNRKFLRGSKRPLREQAPELLEIFLRGLGGRKA